MEIEKRPRGRPRKVVAVPAQETETAGVPPILRKARRYRPPAELPAFVPQFGRRYREPKRKPVLHPFAG